MVQENKESHAQSLFRDSHTKKTPQSCPGIDPPGATGVIYVTDRATANGFKGNEDKEWANFGQGAPETGHIPGASERQLKFDLTAYGDDVLEYAPTTGVRELREAVANYYNETYRKGKSSQYSFKNVCIVPGGRAGLSRVAAIIGEVYTGYFLPEYTAYDQMLSVFRKLVPIPSALDEKDQYTINVGDLRKLIKAQGIQVIAASNPRNPTGQGLAGQGLADLIELSREGTTMILDEFYSWYNYREGEEGISHSAAAFVEDVNEDPVILIDGLTKNWRLPGARCCWVVAPESVISALSQSGSFLDGGASHLVQCMMIPYVSDLKRVQQDKVALQRHFKAKRDFVLDRLEKMGLKVDHPPEATFYIWLDLQKLPPPLNEGQTFFEELLKFKVIVVPGLSFDVNPSHRRNLADSPCHHFVRLSFGPPQEVLERGLNGIEALLKQAHYLMTEKGHLEDLGRDYVRNAVKNHEHPGAGS